jgi:hypothetical protein
VLPNTWGIMKPRELKLSALAFLVSVVAGSACSHGTGNPDSGSSAGAGGHAGTGSAGTGSAGSGSASTDGGGTGSAGSGSAGTDGGAGGGGGGNGAAGSDAGVDAAPAGDASVNPKTDASGDATSDAPTVEAAPLKSAAGAVILGTTGNHLLLGTATFRDNQGVVTLGITLIQGCYGDTHNFHLHQNNLCGADGSAAGGHWTPKGDTNLGVVTCIGGGTGSALYVTPSAGYWTIGGDVSTNILNHAVVIDGNSSDPAPLIACGVPQ